MSCFDTVDYRWSVIETYCNSVLEILHLLIVSVSLPQCCTPFTFGLGVAHGHKGCHDGNAGIHLLPCWREFRQSHAVFTCGPVFTDNSAATHCLTPLILSKPLTTQQLIFSSNASITNGLKKTGEAGCWMKGFISPHHELTRTSGGVRAPHLVLMSL